MTLAEEDKQFSVRNQEWEDYKANKLGDGDHNFTEYAIIYILHIFLIHS